MVDDMMLNTAAHSHALVKALRCCASDALVTLGQLPDLATKLTSSTHVVMHGTSTSPMRSTSACTSQAAKSHCRPRRRCGLHAMAAQAQAQGQVVFPPSLTVSKHEGYSLRLYEPFVALEVPYEKREDGYDAAASYFGGMNEAGMTFQETQPTFLCYARDGAKRMRLYVGPTRSGDMLDDPPAPEMPDCRLVAAGGELVAVARFVGYITPTTAQAALEQLEAALARDGVEAAEEHKWRFRVCQYGPVYSLSGRENEMVLQVKP
jgi:SOUL heme-binding protein